jgi:hypothetical protein
MNNYNFIKKHYKIFLAIVFILIVVVIPFLINLSFKVSSIDKIFTAEWSAGEMLSYYGSIILGSVTIYLAYISIKQAKYANNINEKLLNIEQINKRVYLEINLEKSSINIEKDKKILNLEFKNITDNIITFFTIENSQKLLMNTNWIKNEKSINGSVVTELYITTNRDPMEDIKIIQGSVQFDNLSDFIILVFKIRMKSIYGLETIQYFNIILINDKIISYKTSV